MSPLEGLAQTFEFHQAKKSEQAEMILWFIWASEKKTNGVDLSDVGDAFEELLLVRPKTSRIKVKFRASRNIRSLRNGRYAPSRAFADQMSAWIEIDNDSADFEAVPDKEFEVDGIPFPPFVGEERRDQLKMMLKCYAHLFFLENSMRGLIETVLERELGDDWWDKAASNSMKEKHRKRMDNEKTNKWAPTRSEFGPLYAVDWSDLVTIMRKFPKHFSQYFSDPNFLHRYDDVGAFRNVVAHNGVLKDKVHFDRIRMYYRDWILQVT